MQAIFAKFRFQILPAEKMILQITFAVMVLNIFQITIQGAYVDWPAMECCFQYRLAAFCLVNFIALAIEALALGSP